MEEWLVLCFYCPSLSPSLLTWLWAIEYMSVVLFCFVIFWMLCYVMCEKKKNVDNKKKKYCSYQTCVFCITSAVSVLGVFKPCPREFYSLLKVYLFWTCHVSILHQNATLRPSSNTPATREVDWMNGSDERNKNASRQTDAQRFLLLLERKICSGPSLRSFEYSVLITTEASKLKKWYSDQP